MNMTETREPRVCDIILAQLGGGGLRGAVCYCGGRNLVGSDRSRAGECHGSRFAAGGLIEESTEGFLRFKVNGKRNETWLMHISLELSDTYTVYLQAINKKMEILWTEKREDVYCDEVKDVVETMYDEAIRKYNGGFINLD